MEIPEPHDTIVRQWETAIAQIGLGNAILIFLVGLLMLIASVYLLKNLQVLEFDGYANVNF